MQDSIKAELLLKQLKHTRFVADYNITIDSNTISYEINDEYAVIEYWYTTTSGNKEHLLDATVVEVKNGVIRYELRKAFFLSFADGHIDEIAIEYRKSFIESFLKES